VLQVALFLPSGQGDLVRFVLAQLRQLSLHSISD
jgi:hypothetical protein